MNALMESMLGNMGLPFEKGAKVNMGAFQSMMKTNIKKVKAKERMMKKLNENRKEKELEEQVRKILRMSNIKKANRKKFVHKTFRSGDQSSDKPQKNKRQNKKKQRRRKNKKKVKQNKNQIIDRIINHKNIKNSKKENITNYYIND